MKLSTEGILTTHTGSLPRPEELVKLTYEQEEGKPVDHDVMAGAQARAVEQVVRRQAEAGIDVVSDGEMAKPGFTNYLTSRVTGYEGRAAPWMLDDLKEFPDLVMEQYGGEGMASMKGVRIGIGEGIAGRAGLETSGLDDPRSPGPVSFVSGPTFSPE